MEIIGKEKKTSRREMKNIESFLSFYLDSKKELIFHYY